MTALIKKIFFRFFVPNSVPWKFVVAFFADIHQIFEVKTNACVSYVARIEHNLVMNNIAKPLMTYLTQTTVDECSFINEASSAILPFFRFVECFCKIFSHNSLKINKPLH